MKQWKLNPKKEWIDYLASKGLKLYFYRFVLLCSKTWNVCARYLNFVLVLGVLISSIVSLLYVLNLLRLNVSAISEIQALASESSLYLTLLLQIMVIFSAITIIGGFAVFYLIFPINTLSNFPDTSDIPISFIQESINELNLFEFDAEEEKRQSNKKRISNLINNALEFISIEDKIWAVPQGLRYHKIIVGGINNKSSRMDLLYRVNGLYIKLNGIIINLNCMNNIESREQISVDLKKCLEMIEDKEICAIEKVKFDETNNTFSPFGNIIESLIHLIKIVK
ncbi:MAG: hypothetical protein KAH86_05655 [Methanosarcinales archaeon]|nr:hypothetical protein [Methanosarcinales archaeon]